MAAARVLGRTVTLKVKFADFRQITRARTVGAVGDRAALAGAGHALLDALLPVENGVRLLGLTVSGFEEEDGAQAALPL